MDQTHKCWRHQLSEKKFHRSIIQMEMSPKPPKQIYCPKMVPTAIVKPGEHTHWQPWLSTYILPFFYFRQYLGHIPTHFYMSGINSLWASVKLKQACTTEPVPTFIAYCIWPGWLWQPGSWQRCYRQPSQDRSINYISLNQQSFSLIVPLWLNTG